MNFNLKEKLKVKAGEVWENQKKEYKENKAFKQILTEKAKGHRRRAYAKEFLKQSEKQATAKAKVRFEKPKFELNQNEIVGNLFAPQKPLKHLPKAKAKENKKAKAELDKLLHGGW